MSAATDVRRFVLQARHALEAAQDKIRVSQAPAEVREALDAAEARVNVAETKAATWAETLT